MTFRDSITVSIPACHAGDRGSIPRRGGFFSYFITLILVRGRTIISPMVKFVPVVDTEGITPRYLSTASSSLTLNISTEE